MIIIDTETTGLHEITAAPLAQQPHIIEIGIMKLNDKTLKTQSIYSTLINPGVAIPEKVSTITGITAEMLIGKKRFAAYYLEIARMFLGEQIIIGHNLPYDVQMLIWELQRLDKIAHFPWPMTHYCTVELTQDLTGKYQSLTDLYIHYYGIDPEQKHRGMGDTEILAEVVRAMRKEGRL